jgi:hypothetical protein
MLFKNMLLVATTPSRWLRMNTRSETQRQKRAFMALLTPWRWQKMSFKTEGGMVLLHVGAESMDVRSRDWQEGTEAEAEESNWDAKGLEE